MHDSTWQTFLGDVLFVLLNFMFNSSLDWRHFAIPILSTEYSKQQKDRVGSRDDAVVFLRVEQQSKRRTNSVVGFCKESKTSCVETLVIYEDFTVLVQYSSWQLAKSLIMWCASSTSHGADLLSLIIFMSTAPGLRHSLKILNFK